MNWFMVAGGFLLLGASAEALIRQGSYRMMVVYACWAVSNFFLAGVK